MKTVTLKVIASSPAMNDQSLRGLIVTLRIHLLSSVPQGVVADKVSDALESLIEALIVRNTCSSPERCPQTSHSS